jgi:D-xylose reductase
MQAAKTMTHLTVQSGEKMPTVGFGMWKIAKDQTAEATYQAIKAGYRLIDQACDYGNEKECGEGIKKAIDEGLVKREELWVTSKLWNTFHRKEHVKAACQKSLKDLGLDYLDLYLIHFPIALKYVDPEVRYPPEWIFDPSSAEPRMEEDNVSYQETWRAMEELAKEGLTKNIGCSNIGTTMLRDVLNYAEVKPAVLQVEMHPYNTQDKLLRFCDSKGIAVTAFSSFGAGSYVELGMATVQESCLEE